MFSDKIHLVNELLPQISRASEVRLKQASFLQLIGKPGSGCRRLVFDFLTDSQDAVWISREWNLYAPLLWKLAEQAGTQLIGVECQKKRLRLLWKELFHLQSFDTWILDYLDLKVSDAAFLEKLIRHSSLKIIVLDQKPYPFCKKRAHIHLTNRSYRISWSKGGPRSPEYRRCDFLDLFMRPPHQLSEEERCLSSHKKT